MMAIEPVLQERRPDWVVVVGDVNATAACAIVASSLHIPVAHIEAGLRSFDRAMPEEINRIVTDRLADLLFTPERPRRSQPLARGRPAEAYPPRRQYHDRHPGRQSRRGRRAGCGRDCRGEAPAGTAPLPEGPGGNAPAPFALLTLHRPSNVDEPAMLRGARDAVFVERCRRPHAPRLDPASAHPRPSRNIRSVGPRLLAAPRLRARRAASAIVRCCCLNMAAGLVLTDSGGLQEECCVLGTPCITLRDTTRNAPLPCGNTAAQANWSATIRLAFGRPWARSTLTGSTPPAPASGMVKPPGALYRHCWSTGAERARRRCGRLRVAQRGFARVFGSTRGRRRMQTNGIRQREVPERAVGGHHRAGGRSSATSSTWSSAASCSSTCTRHGSCPGSTRTSRCGCCRSSRTARTSSCASMPATSSARSCARISASPMTSTPSS